jgi:hypothetical protein
LAYKNSESSLNHIDTSLIFFLFHKICEKFGLRTTIDTIYPAPSKESLDMFGGPLSIEEFRNLTERSNLQCNIFTYPLEPVPQFMQISNQHDTIDDNIVTNNSMHSSEKRRLKLYRTKPLPYHKNTLEASMGLFIN